MYASNEKLCRLDNRCLAKNRGRFGELGNGRFEGKSGRSEELNRSHVGGPIGTSELKNIFVAGCHASGDQLRFALGFLQIGEAEKDTLS